MTSFADRLVDIFTRIEELERRFENRQRTGTIHEVDAEKGLARVKLGEDPETGEPYLSAWVPWKEISMGFIKTHFPPEPGEQVKLVSESGDLTDAVIDYSLPSNQFKRPHNKAREAMIKIGEKTSLLMTEGKVVLKTPHKRVEAGKIEFQQSTAGGTQPTGPTIPMSDIPVG